MKNLKPDYLDYNATTPVDPRVVEIMNFYFTQEFGNAGSRTHIYGQNAKSAVNLAREVIADSLMADPAEIVFTSGATESNNLALLGLQSYSNKVKKKHIISSIIEHKAVLEPLEYLESIGYEVEYCPVTEGGFVDPAEVQKRIRKDTLLVSIMYSNNETGVIQPVHEISEMIFDKDIFFHVDAAQAFGKEIEGLKELNCDFLSVSGHKIYGPKGIGALYTRRKDGYPCDLKPIMFGGGQERGLRPGTLAVPLIAGLGKATEIAISDNKKRKIASGKKRKEVLEMLKGFKYSFNGDQDRVQEHVMNIKLDDYDSEAFMIMMKDEFAISNGSACTSEAYKDSYVLSAMGVDEPSNCVRVSF